MNFIYPNTLPPLCHCRTMFTTTPTMSMPWHTSIYYLPPAMGHHPQTYLAARNTRGANESVQEEFHHFYKLSPVPNVAYPYLYTQPRPVPPIAASPARPPRLQPLCGPWPEGFTLTGELRWGRLERVYGPRQELPEFVKDDLRRVYGTYPRTDVAITYRGGEYVVRGDPRVGQQEYTVERRVERREYSPEGDSVSEAVESKKRRGKKKRR